MSYYKYPQTWLQKVFSNRYKISQSAQGFYSQKSVGRSMILDTVSAQVKKFIHFISLMPDVDDGVFLIYPGEMCKPKPLLNLYPQIDENFMNWFQLYIAEIFVNNKSHLLIGLDFDYLSLIDRKATGSEKHLILLYLFRKIKNKRFVICFDDESIKSSDFDNVKITFNLLASVLRLQDVAYYYDSCMILTTHSKNSQQMIKLTEKQISSSLNQPQGFYQHHQFTHQIMNKVIKNKRVFEIHRKIQVEKFQQKKAQFKQALQKLTSFKSTQDNLFRITDKYLMTLTSKNQQFMFGMIKQSQKPKKQYQTPNPDMQKIHMPQTKGITQILLIWDGFFQTFIQYVIQKIKRGSNHFSTIKSKQRFIITKPAQKFTVLGNSSQIRRGSDKYICEAYKLIQFYSSLLKFLVANYQKGQQLKKSKNNNQKAKKDFLMAQLKSFIRIFYRCNILNPNNDQKIIFDYFMIFEQLVQLWSGIQQTQDKKHNLDDLQNEKSQPYYFSPNQLMRKALYDNSTVTKKFLVMLQNMCIHQISIQINKVRTGKYVIIEHLKQPIQKIKQILPKLKNIFQLKDEKQFISERLSKLIKEIDVILTKRKLNELNGKPVQRLTYLIQLLQCSKKVYKDKELLTNLGKTVLQYSREYKQLQLIEQQKLNRIVIKLLSNDEFMNINLILGVHQQSVEQILLRKRKINNHIQFGNSLTFTQQQSKAIQEYIKFLLKLNLTEKARQVSYRISMFNQQFSKRLICRCLLIKENIKSHVELIYESQNQKRDKRFEKQQEISQVIQEIKEYLLTKNVQLDKQKEQEDNLIDI